MRSDPRRHSRNVAPLSTELVSSYGFTPAEGRVTAAIVAGYSVKEVAPALNISAATVRVHLRRIFAKTGAHRQAALVRLVLGGMSQQAHNGN